MAMHIAPPDGRAAREQRGMELVTAAHPGAERVGGGVDAENRDAVERALIGARHEIAVAELELGAVRSLIWNLDEPFHRWFSARTARDLVRGRLRRGLTAVPRASECPSLSQGSSKMNAKKLFSMVMVAGALAACGDDTTGSGGSAGTGGAGTTASGTTSTTATTGATTVTTVTTGGDGGATSTSNATGTSVTSGTGGESGTGGATGSGGGGPTTSASTSTATSSGSGGAPAFCDEAPVCQDGDVDPTNDCASCAFAGPCSDQYNTCLNDAECLTFNDCFSQCGQGDQACVDGCVSDNPAGANLYNELIVCTVCDVCPVTCDGPGAGCP